MRSLFLDYLFPIVGFVGGLFAIAGSDWSVLAKLAPETTWAVIFLGVMMLWFFGDSLQLRSRLKRKARYADAISRLNRGFQEIHHLARRQKQQAGTISEDTIVRHVTELCNRLTEIFTDVTRGTCSVCVKVLRSDSETGALDVETLCRNSDADNRRLMADRESESKGIVHTISDNTAFSQAMASVDRASTRGFMSNALPLLELYKNTSFEVYGKPQGFLSRILNWPLPYKSTIVVPIVPSHPEETEKKSKVLGFLCVDCEKMGFGVFRSDVDYDIMIGVADGMYNTLSEFKHVFHKP